jgi:peptidoglycan hydrolase-like protein with peptidoglycan-binding domain
MPDVTQAQIEAFLREHGLVPDDYNGPVTVTAKTSEGDETITINV